jgi:hypothetical protein
LLNSAVLENSTRFVQLNFINFFAFFFRCRPESIYKRANLDENSNLIDEKYFMMPIEINTRMGGSETWSMIKSSHKVDLLREYVNISLGLNLNEESLICKEKNPCYYCISKDFHPAKRVFIESIKVNVKKLKILEDIVQVVIFRSPHDYLDHLDAIGWITVKHDLSPFDMNFRSKIDEALECIKFDFSEY